MRAKIATLTLTLLALPTAALPCTVGAGPPESWPRHAEVIIRARAVDQFAIEPKTVIVTSNGQKHTFVYPQFEVRFEVLEVLKGKLDEHAVEFEGWFSNRDDPNDGSVPYRMVREEGRSGNCHANTYKKGGEYLLMLRTRIGALTPYWASMGATNEQLFGPDDRWLAWVRQQLRGAK